MKRKTRLGKVIRISVACHKFMNLHKLVFCFVHPVSGVVDVAGVVVISVLFLDGFPQEYLFPELQI